MTEEEFDALAEQWMQDTAIMSNIRLANEHEAIQKIIAAGEEVLPYIYKRLANPTVHWFYALTQITGVDAAQGETTVSGARIAWIKWLNKRLQFSVVPGDDGYYCKMHDQKLQAEQIKMAFGDQTIYFCPIEGCMAHLHEEDI